MRSLGLTLFVAFALFGFAVASNSPRFEAVAAYRAQVEAMAIYEPQWRALLDADVVDIEVDDDGHVDASLRAEGCTMPTLDAHLAKNDDGRWEVTFVHDDAFYPGTSAPPVCKEGGEVPPPELAWTWQDRPWR
jgi:hypothetical protein